MVERVPFHMFSDGFHSVTKIRTAGVCEKLGQHGFCWLTFDFKQITFLIFILKYFKPT